jgi:hypothetical protein
LHVSNPLSDLLLPVALGNLSGIFQSLVTNGPPVLNHKRQLLASRCIAQQIH